MKLSVVMSNRNDLVMLNVTLNVLLEQFKDLPFDCEIIIGDNSDKREWDLMGVAIPYGWKKNGWVKVIHDDRPGFTAARHLAAKEASGEYIFCIDSHVIVGQHTLQDSVSFMDRHAGDSSLGFGHPPIRWAHQGPAAVKHTLKIAPSGNPNGGWDCCYLTERKMWWKFMPWICRREWFLDTLQGYGTHASEYVSWGGAEALMQVKSWMLGYENWAIPTDAVIHIGPYTPDVIKTGQYKYRTYGAHGQFPHGFGVLLALAILCGPEYGYKLAMADVEKFYNRHKIRPDDVQSGRKLSYWELACEVGKAEHERIARDGKWNYKALIEAKPWESAI